MLNVFLVFFLLLTPYAVHAATVFGGEWEVNGFVKSLNVYQNAPPTLPLDDLKISSNRVRLNLVGQLPLGLEADIALEQQVQWADPPLVPLPGELASRRLDLERNWNNLGRVSGQLQVDRLSLRGRAGELEWTLGRQAIGFGRVTLFSPLDIIAPFPPTSLDTEVRPGIDALRLSAYRGLAGQYEIITVLGQTGGQNSQLLSITENWQGMDLLALGGNLLGRPVVGMGLAGEVWGAGLKGELTWYNGKEGDFQDHFWIGAIETDFQLFGNLTIFLQYLYNGAGASDPLDYPFVAIGAFQREGLGFLLGQHYLLAAPSWQVHPLVTVNGLMIWNLQDDSALLRPLIQFSLSDNSVLQAFYSLNLGEQPANVIIPRSEFGSVGDSFGLFYKYFF